VHQAACALDLDRLAYAADRHRRLGDRGTGHHGLRPMLAAKSTLNCLLDGELHIRVDPARHHVAGGRRQDRGHEDMCPFKKPVLESTIIVAWG
jgi:hypothetical protein